MRFGNNLPLACLLVSMVALCVGVPAARTQPSVTFRNVHEAPRAEIAKALNLSADDWVGAEFVHAIPGNAQLYRIELFTRPKATSERGVCAVRLASVNVRPEDEARPAADQALNPVHSTEDQRFTIAPASGCGGMVAYEDLILAQDAVMVGLAAQLLAERHKMGKARYAISCSTERGRRCGNARGIFHLFKSDTLFAVEEVACNGRSCVKLILNCRNAECWEATLDGSILPDGRPQLRSVKITSEGYFIAH